MKSKLLLTLSVLAVLGLSACGETTSSSVPGPEVDSSPDSSVVPPDSSDTSVTPSDSSSSEPEVKKTYTYNTYTTVSPSNWNELTYQDGNDTQIMSRINGSFFTYNYEFDRDGKIVPGGFTVDYDAVEVLEDVTETYAGDSRYSVPAGSKSGYAYAIGLRGDLKWDDGTPIKAEDFVYTMKEQLNPLFQNYRADSYYNASVIIHNALGYVKQGQSAYFASKDVFAGAYPTDGSIDDQLIFSLGAEALGKTYFASWFDGRYSQYASYAKTYGYAWLLHHLFGLGFDDDDNETITDAQFAALEGKTLKEIKEDEDLKAVWDAIIGWWQTDPGEELDFFVTYYSYPAVDFEDVGLFVGADDLELIIVMDKPLELFKEDGSLSYRAAYNFGSLPLVKRDLYEANKVQPDSTVPGALWTSKYNSSLETTAAWGPYKLTSFQAGKQYILERNENWYGYNMPEYAGQYQTDRIVCNTLAEWNTAWQSFLLGDLDSIGLDVSVAADYKASSRATFQGDEFVGSMQLQSNVEALKSSEEQAGENIDKEMLAYTDFRKALSLSIDRVDYTAKCTTASQAGFGLFNEFHYYDVENGGVYRHEEVAMRVICETYGIDPDDYPSLEDAYAAVTGYNPTLAKELITSSYNEALEAGTIDEDDVVTLKFGTAADNEAARRHFDYLTAAFKDIVVGTPLEGRLETVFDASFGDNWSNSFRSGAYEICLGGWEGGAWDPGYFIGAYVLPSSMYSKGWDTENEMLSYNPWGDEEEGHSELTMGLLDWYNCLNGTEDAKYKWNEGAVPTEFRLGIIAAMEKVVLGKYYTVPLYNYYSASLLSYKVEYGSNTYNTFMGFGGLRYMTYNYDDAAWEAVKDSFNYKA